MKGLRFAGSIVMTLVLAACAGGPFAAQAPADTMAGHWKLSSPNAPFCDMNFEGGPDQTHGTIHPDGGCPGKFYMSRKWALANDKLIIADEQDQPLATLELGSSGFEGTSLGGLPVVLTR